jgi:hypothetical protein
VTIEGIKQDPIIAVCSVASPHDILDQAITKARNLLEDMDLSMLQLEALWGDRGEFCPPGLIVILNLFSFD